MNQQEIQGVAKRIESLVKRVVVAEERGKQQEAALALIAIHMGQDRDAFDSMDLVAHIKASQARSADERAAMRSERDGYKDLAASYKREIGALKAERDDLRQIVEMVHADLRIKQGDHIGQAIGALKKEVERLRSEVEPLRQESARNEAAAWNAKKGVEHLRSEVESLRAKLSSRTVEWPEWAKEGTRVRVRSRECSFQNHWASIGDELTIVGVDRARWIAMTARGEIDVRDLEPVAEHVAPPVVPPQPQVGDKVRLIKRPSTADYDGRQWDYTWGETGEIAVVNYVGLCVNVIRANGCKNDWPLSCVEVVK